MITQVNEYGESEPRVRITTLSAGEAQRCAEPARLCLRLQNWAGQHARGLDLALERSKYLWVRGHLVADEGEMTRLIGSSLDECSIRSERSREPKPHRCRRCNVVVQLEVLYTVSDGPATVFTKWLDLGSGSTPMDPKWRVLTAAFQDGDNVNEHAREADRCRLDLEK